MGILNLHPKLYNSNIIQMSVWLATIGVMSMTEHLVASLIPKSDTASSFIMSYVDAEGEVIKLEVSYV
jgi:hypothetical protein